MIIYRNFATLTCGWRDGILTDDSFNKVEWLAWLQQHVVYLLPVALITLAFIFRAAINRKSVAFNWFVSFLSVPGDFCIAALSIFAAIGARKLVQLDGLVHSFIVLIGIIWIVVVYMLQATAEAHLEHRKKTTAWIQFALSFLLGLLMFLFAVYLNGVLN